MPQVHLIYLLLACQAHEVVLIVFDYSLLSTNLTNIVFTFRTFKLFLTDINHRSANYIFFTSIFEGDFADMMSGTINSPQVGSEDPHERERNFMNNVHSFL